MSLHRPYLLTAFFIAFILCQAEHSARGQNVYIGTSSAISYDGATNKVKSDRRSEWLGGWTTIITNCGFDTACINNNRIAVARGFLESAENFANNPALANPGSHTYNREYVRLCYDAFLNRPAEPAGWDGWTNYIDSHPREYSNLVGGFINSTEYRNRFIQ